MSTTHKAGFISIIGKPNVGKSTLMNALLGEQLSVVTPKAQTTRHRIKGILNAPDYQLIFSDTPGIMKPAYKLHERMLGSVDATIADADAVMLVVEVHERGLSPEIESRLLKSEAPLVMVINKIDLSEQELLEERVKMWDELLHPIAIIPVSALENFNIEAIVETLVRLIPEHPAYFDKDDLSDRNVRFFVQEMIREKLLLQYKKEIPYSCEVLVQEFKEGAVTDVIRCDIYVDRESQKAILLGHKGTAIKNLGIASRTAIEKFTGKKAHLELTIKVKGDWRNDEKQLDQFGYKD
ncbi:MAG TPA: GTPase Era [Bacteroidia bacterium]|nr:GTPase Era [Bacteroidia bacterium]